MELIPFCNHIIGRPTYPTVNTVALTRIFDESNQIDSSTAGSGGFCFCIVVGIILDAFKEIDDVFL